MPRGGKRPGAGAPRGNLNALKDGRRSVQVAAVLALLSSPGVERVTRQLRRQRLRREQALQQAAQAAVEIIRRRRRQTINQNDP